MKRIMKKIVIASTLMMMTTIVNAQHYFYHNVGDTIWGRDTVYHYQWWTDNWIHNNEDSAINLVGVSELKYGADLCGGEYMMYHYTDHPIQVIGLAGMALSRDLMSPLIVFTDSTDLPEYFVLYDATADSLIHLKSMRWRSTDPHRTIHFELHLENSHQGCDLRYDSLYYPLFEYYFEDKPITVTDSFYVGCTYHSYLVGSVEGAVNHNYRPVYGGLGEAMAYGYSTCQQMSDQHFIFKPEKDNAPYVYAGQIYHVFEQKVMAVFPIIQIDTSYAFPDTVQYVCPTVDNIRLADTTDNIAVLMWNSRHEHRGWQASIVPRGESPDSGIIDTVLNQPFFVTPRLDSCITYNVYVRAVCEHRGEIYHSEWGNPITLRYCDTPDTTDVPDNPDTNEVFVMSLNDNADLTYLIPNPANNLVSVVSSYMIERVEIYGVDGTKQADIQTEGYSVTFNVSAWRKGSYVLIIHSQGGVVTKKLIVN